MKFAGLQLHPLLILFKQEVLWFFHLLWYSFCLLSPQYSLRWFCFILFFRKVFASWHWMYTSQFLDEYIGRSLLYSVRFSHLVHLPQRCSLVFLRSNLQRNFKHPPKISPLSCCSELVTVLVPRTISRGLHTILEGPMQFPKGAHRMKMTTV